MHLRAIGAAQVSIEPTSDNEILSDLKMSLAFRLGAYYDVTDLHFFISPIDIFIDKYFDLWYNKLSQGAQTPYELN